MQLSDIGAGAPALSNAALYTELTTALPDTVPTCIGVTLVVPSHTDTSIILKKVSATPTCGAQMPFGCGASGTCLTTDQINVISSWIAGGALH